MWPDLERSKDAPRGSQDLGDGYILLGPKDTNTYRLSPPEQMTLKNFFPDLPDDNLQYIY